MSVGKASIKRALGTTEAKAPAAEPAKAVAKAEPVKTAAKKPAAKKTSLPKTEAKKPATKKVEQPKAPTAKKTVPAAAKADKMTFTVGEALPYYLL